MVDLDCRRWLARHLFVWTGNDDSLELLLVLDLLLTSDLVIQLLALLLSGEEVPNWDIVLA